MTLRDYLEELAEKHKFNLETVGNVLMISPNLPGRGELVIGVWKPVEDQRFSIGRIIFNTNGPDAGFTVWLDADGEPVRAKNDFGSIVSDLDLAEEEMIDLIEMYYLESDRSEQVFLPQGGGTS